jgi:hypothetical protein
VTRRVVRVTPEFFRHLDAQLPAERGPDGEPTAAEFAASDLLNIVDTFADEWDTLAMPYPGRGDYRDLWVHTRLVYAAAVRGQLSPVDGAIELIAISTDLHGLDHGPDDDEDEPDD